jgi:hypothetical protein
MEDATGGLRSAVGSSVVLRNLSRGQADRRIDCSDVPARHDWGWQSVTACGAGRLIQVAHGEWEERAAIAALLG